VEPFLYGVKPAVIAVILGAVGRLGRPAVKDWRFAVLGVAVIGVLLANLLTEVPALLLGGVVGMLWFRAGKAGDSDTASRYLPILFLQQGGLTEGVGQASAGAAAVAVSLPKVFLFFLKIGAVLYGSGYVLVAFLEGGLVTEMSWLTQAQLLDAIAIGQLTPGPVLSTSTFIGYLLDGVPGAVAATVGIFLPSFFFVLLLNPLIPRLRDSAWMSAFLDAVNVSALALMVAVTIDLATSVLVSWPAWTIAVGAGFLVLRFRTNAAWLVLGGAVVGRALWPWVS
jgi:chromate transporter